MISNYKSFSIILLLIGCIGLLASLRPAKQICGIEEKQEVGWKTLGAMIVFFVAGYFFYIYHIIVSPWSPTDLIVSIILCGGGFFVALVVRMSLLTIKGIRRLSALERHRALHDELTDLPNRNLLHERIDALISESSGDRNSFALLLIDIDRFKDLNDALGHNYGDYILQIVAVRFCQSVRGSDTVCRLGGDEFAILLPSSTEKDAVFVCEKLLGCLEVPFKVEGSNLKLDISIGIAMFPTHGLEAEALLQHADIAMYNAKRVSKTYQFYNDDQDKYNLNRLALIANLREAITKGEFVLYYQPKVSVQQQRVEGVEALIRWESPGREMIMPDSFIELAEETGLINQITIWVVDHTLAQIAQWRSEGIILAASINLSAVNLHDLAFPDKMQGLLRKWQIDPAAITFEITESSMVVDPERTREVIKKLHQLKVHLSIDDFGTGYSSLSYLKELPVSEIKIDKSFVGDMLKDENDAVIVKATLELAHNMGLKVVAEGVSSLEISEALQKMNCDYMQGNYLYPPMPADVLIRALEKSGWTIP